MRIDTTNFIEKNLSNTKEPFYAIKIFWDLDSTDYTYYTSHNNTDVELGAISAIYSVVKNISSTSQKLNPIQARSTIGSINFNLVDVNQSISTLMYEKLKPVKVTGNITFTASNKQITGVDFSTLILKKYIDITGTTNNNGRFTISSLSGSTITVVETLVNETNAGTSIEGNEESLKGRKVEVYAGYKDLAFTDYTLVQTQIIDNLNYKDGLYTINCSDIQRSMRKDIFTLSKTRLYASLDNSSTTNTIATDPGGIIAGVIRVTQKFGEDISGFETYEHGPTATFNANTTRGYFKIDDEIISYTGTQTTPYHAFTGCYRGNTTTGELRSKRVEHVVDSALAENKPEIEEFVYLEMPAVKLAYAILTGKLDGQPGKELPNSWHLGIPESFVAKEYFTNIGETWWTPTATGGESDDDRKIHFRGINKVDGKKFLETEIYLMLGAYAPILNNGKIAFKRMTGVFSGSPYTFLLNEDNIISYSNLISDMKQVYNTYKINWSWDFRVSKFTRHDVLTDSRSINTYGRTNPLIMNFKGLHDFTDSDISLRKTKDTVRDRYNTPPLQLSLECLPSTNNLEIGDIIRVALTSLQDFSSGSSLSRSFEVQEVAIDWVTGNVKLSLFGASKKPYNEDISALSTSTTILPSSFYNTGLNAANEFNATNVTSWGGTYSSGTVTGNVSISGTADMTSVSSIFWHTGDLEIKAGSTLNISGNVQLRVLGQLTISGEINGVGGGLSGLQYPSNNTGRYPSEGKQNIGVTQAQGSLLATYSNFLATINYTSLEAKTSKSTKQSIQDSVSTNIVEYINSKLTNIPTDLRGSSGGLGGSIEIRRQKPGNNAGFNPSASKIGGNGGNGGAGLCIISRGTSLTNGLINLSGAEGQPGQTAKSSDTGFGLVANEFLYSFAGGGAGGASGGLLILVEGNTSVTPNIYFDTEINEGTFISLNGTTPVHNPTVPTSGNTGIMYVVKGDNRFASSYNTGISNYRTTEAASHWQYIEGEQTVQADVPSQAAKPATVSVSTTLGIANIPLNTISTSITVTPATVSAPEVDVYSYSKIYYRLNGSTDGFSYLGVASNVLTVNLPMDTSNDITYEFIARSISTSGNESEDYTSTTFTIPNQPTGGAGATPISSGYILGAGNFVSSGDPDNIGQGSQQAGFVLDNTGLKLYPAASTAYNVFLDASNGNATFTGTITATAGKIANWSISGDTLTAGNITLDATSGAEKITIGSTITLDSATSKIQVGPDASNYIKLDSSGIVGLDATLGTVFNIPLDGSAPTFASGIINSTVFNITNAGIMRTASTVGDGSANSQGILINDTGIKSFAANSSNPNVHISAINGTISINDWGSDVSGTGIPAANATLGATWGTNITNEPSTTQIYNNLLDLNDWVIGTAGTQGSFIQSGSNADNDVFISLGPNGISQPVWRASPDGTGGASGGWEATINNLDSSKTYRSIVFIKKTNSSDGTTYHGASNDADTINLDNTAISSPYFWQGDLPQLNKWYLLVGIIHGYTTWTTVSSNISGVYDLDTGIRVLVGTDFKMKSGTTKQEHRAYLYFDSNTVDRQYFAAPRFEEVNGQEASLESMMYGKLQSISAGADVTVTAMNTGVSLSSGGITLGTSSKISSGQTAFDTGTGFWLEAGSGTPKFSIGKSTGNKLTWDGTDLLITGHISSGSHITGSAFTTSGSHITSALSGGETNVILHDATDFPTSGSGYFIDSTNNNDAFSWAGKSANTLTGCTGVLAHNSDATVVFGQAIITSELTNEQYFYADIGSGVIGKVVTIGKLSTSGNSFFATFGTQNSNNANNFGILALSYNKVGLYALSTNDFGILASSTNNTGLNASSDATSGVFSGVYASADSTSGRGVFGYATASTGTTYGIYGTSASTGGRGVYGYASASTGTTYGIYGDSASTGGKGVYGYASASTGSTYGIYGHSASTGGIGTIGWASATTGASVGVYAVGDSSSGYDFYAGGAGVNYGPFTGGHEGLIDKKEIVGVGDILIDIKIISRSNVSNTIGINTKSTYPKDSSAIGVFVGRNELNIENLPAALNNEENIAKQYIDTHDRVSFNAVGEGQVNVCGQNGNINKGDYICTSSISGKGMKQDDNIYRSYTVAKARESVIFEDKEEIQMIACIYLCG